MPLPDFTVYFCTVVQLVYLKKNKNQCKSKCHNKFFYSVFRPNDAVDEGREASLPNTRDITSEPYRRELIANLAEHILFSKCSSITVSYLFCLACCMN